MIIGNLCCETAGVFQHEQRVGEQDLSVFPQRMVP